MKDNPNSVVFPLVYDMSSHRFSKVKGQRFFHRPTGQIVVRRKVGDASGFVRVKDLAWVDFES